MSRRAVLSGRIDDIDVQIEKIHRLIESASRIDPELAAGMATGESLGSVQRKIDQASAACEDVDHHVRQVLRLRGK
ncbi:hypothetical protein ABT332_22955 [Saccharomonospora azurea]|uniref:hypothetical protein n=1 Tax=Saccharomonospora azurea TaxID=40988 RepID=UPI00332E1AEE